MPSPWGIFGTGGGGIVNSVVAGTGISVNSADPANPIVSATGSSGGSVLRANKGMAASLTTADGQVACATTVATTPAASSTLGGYIAVRVNGVGYEIGDGTKVAVDCYFSGDGGTTARAMKSIVAGDLLYWNGSVAGFQLATTDRIDFVYNVTT